MKDSLYLIVFLFSLIFSACQQKSAETEEVAAAINKSGTFHFEIENAEQYKIIRLKRPFLGGDIVEKYVLYSKNSAPPEEDSVTHFIPLPLDRVAINSTTHLGYIHALGEANKITAATNPDLYFNENFCNRIKNNSITSLGNRQINHEQLINSNCDLLFSYAIDGSAYKEIERLRQLGQKVILVAEFMERDPLDKAKWLEFFGAFFDREEKADSVLNAVYKEYNGLKETIQNIENKPSVMIGLPWQGSWYVSGGESFQANYFKAAGAEYIWKDIKQEGGVPLTFEKVVQDALNADYWLNPGSIGSSSELLEKDIRFKEFKPVSNAAIYTNYKRSNAKGANDYWESGVVRADLVLKDLLLIFHPDLLAESEFTYYKKLSED